MPTIDQRVETLEKKVEKLLSDLVALRNALTNWQEKFIAWKALITIKEAENAQKEENQKRNNRRRL